MIVISIPSSSVTGRTSASPNDVARSIKYYEERIRCYYGRCSGERSSGPYCATHARMVPDDLMARIEWAVEDGDEIDWQAALRAAADYIRGGA